MTPQIINSTIQGAWYAAEKLRPYKSDSVILNAITPAGGEWDCVVETGAICRSIVWRGQEVCIVNARGDLDDETEGQIAMALRAAPILDKALRVILNIVTGDFDAISIELIRRIAETAISVIEMPAPSTTEPKDDLY
jgi:hypothetical protein